MPRAWDNDKNELLSNMFCARQDSGGYVIAHGEKKKQYLGVFILRANKFKCSIDQAKRAFFRAANSIFAKVGRLASEKS